MINKNQPKVRFKSFNSEWNKKRLGEVAKVKTGKLDANAMKKYGSYDFYTSGIKKYKIDVPAFKGPAITIAGNGATVGYMHLADGEFNAYQRTYVLSDFQVIREFIFYEIGLKLPKKINQQARKGNIPYIVMDMLTDLNVFIPSLEEQKKIGLLFKHLDENIMTHQQELEILKQTKQGFLQKMFPKDGENVPQFRFDEFTMPWTKIEFEKVIKLVGGATPLKENKEYWNGDIVWLSSQEIKNKYVSKGTYLISEQAVKDNRTKVVSEGTPLIVTRSGILAKRFPISISLNEVAINQDIKALIFDRERIDTEFIVAEIKSKESYILNNIVKTGTTVQSVNLPDLNRMNLYIPEYAEQLKIGEFFRQLDEVIELKEKELEALKETKKGFLQKMFV